MRISPAFLTCLLAGLLSACSSSNDDGIPFAEIIEQGVTRHLGTYTPMSSAEDEGVVNHRFGSGDGPLCLRGGEYTVATRDQNSDELLIFLEGGGACWSSLCAANETAEPGMPTNGVLDPELAENPMRDWNMTYLPYCDGSIFSGDIDRDYEDDGVPENHRGLKNLSAGLDVAQRNFPSPSRIVLAGNSGGGFGTIFALPLVRSLYPGVPIEVMNDSGVGISTPNDPGLQLLLSEDWQNNEFFPGSICPACFDDGNLVEYFKWQLDEDPDTRIAFLSTKRDVVISAGFVGISGEEFEAALLPALAQMEADTPERVRSFVTNGADHTFLQRDLFATGGGVTVHQWLDDMLNGGAAWESTAD